jgi:myosin I
LFRYSLTNNVYKSLQDNNEDQCIIVLGESGSGKTENCRMVIKFLSRMSGKHFPLPLQRQRSSSSLTSNKSTPNSASSTPKHNKSLSATPVLHHHEKSTSCIRTESARNKKSSRVEFDFSYQKCNTISDIEFRSTTKFCPKHNCCNNLTSSSNPIDIPKRKNSSSQDHLLLPATSKSFTIYETMNRVHRSKHSNSISNCVDAIVHNKSDSLDLISTLPSTSSYCSSTSNRKCNKKGGGSSSGGVISGESSSSLDESTLLNRRHSSTTRINLEPNPTTTSIATTTNNNLNTTTIVDINHFNNKQLSYDRNKINLDNFKSAKRKVPIRNLLKLSTQLNNMEVQTMRERIAQAQVFLEAMGCASISRNRDSSRFVSFN